jgi:branched-chain amino acid transport system permease protein
MLFLIQQIVEGLAIGSIYASLALAITLIHRATGIANFAQGEMAMLSTYVAWQLSAFGVPIVFVWLGTLALSFAFGALVQVVFVRRVANADLLSIVIMTFGLFLIFNNAAGLIWGFVTKSLASPFPATSLAVGGVTATWQSLGTIGVLALEMVALWYLFKRTRLGLAMRAAASNRSSAELCGIRVDLLFMLSWGFSASFGAVAGLLIAPRVFVEPNMMSGVLIYGFAAAALGGINSPMGAVVGSLVVGIAESLAVSYVPGLGDLKMVIPFLVIATVLLFKPNGLFSSASGVRV